LNKQVEP